MSGLLLTALAALALAADAPAGTPPPAENTVEGVMVAAPRPVRSAAEELSDRTIEAQLFQLREQQPDRVVCTTRSKTGTRMPQPVCGSLERWFNARGAEDVAAGRAPWQLVEEIKKNKRKAAAANGG